MPKERETDNSENIVRRVGEGDSKALDDLFSRHRDRLRRMVQLRLDRRLRGRLDDSDVLQDVYLEATRRFQGYLADPGVPFFVWLRSIAGQKLIDLHRHHLGMKLRDARREVPLQRAVFPAATSAVLAAQIVGTMTTPSQEVVQAELERKVAEGLEGLAPKDREILVLRHFERLTNAEAAREIGIKESAASRRYLRALLRLRKILESMPGDLWESWTGGDGAN